MKGQLASKRRMLFINLIDEILLLMWDMDKGPRKTLFREVLTCFLKEYSNVAKTTGRVASKDIVFYFRSSNAVEDGSRLCQIIDEMLKLFLVSQDEAKDSESFMKPVISRLLCVYVALAASDPEGVTRCRNFVKKLIKYSDKTPKLVTLSYLNKWKENKGITINENVLLDELSFWNKKHLKISTVSLIQH